MVTKFLQNSRISTLFFERDDHLLCRTMKVKFGLPFLSARIHRKVIHVHFFVSFPPYLQDHCFLRSRNFVTMATRRNDFSSLLFPCRKKTRGSYYLHGGTVCGLHIENQMIRAVPFRIKLICEQQKA